MSDHRLYILLAFISQFCWCHQSSEISATLNPLCDKRCVNTNTNIIHIKYRNVTKCTHFFISVSENNVKYPSVIIAESENNYSNVFFNWDKLFSENISNSIIIENVKESYGVVLLSLFEFDDVTNSADITHATYQNNELLMSNFYWHLTHQVPSVPSNITNRLTVSFKSVSYQSNVPFRNKGFVELNFTVFARSENDPRLPRLYCNKGVCMQIELTLSRLKSRYPHSRYALFIGIVSNQTLSTDHNFRQQNQITINDELSPGVFKKQTVYLDQDNSTEVNYNKNTIPAYLQWRPVCYVDPFKTLQTSRQITAGIQKLPLMKNIFRRVHKSIILALYGERTSQMSPNPIGLRLQNITFGEAKDGYYNATNYTNWSFVISLGHPPKEIFSSHILILFLSGLILLLCIPAVLCIVCYQQNKRNSINEHQHLFSSTTSIDTFV